MSLDQESVPNQAKINGTPIVNGLLSTRETPNLTPISPYYFLIDLG